MKWYKYTLALNINGEIQQSTFIGALLEWKGDFIVINREDGVTTFLNKDIVGQLDMQVIK